MARLLGVLETHLIAKVMPLGSLDTLNFFHILNQGSKGIFGIVSNGLSLLFGILERVDILRNKTIFLLLRPNFILVGQLLEQPNSSFQSLLHKAHIHRLLAILRRFRELDSLICPHPGRRC